MNYANLAGRRQKVPRPRRGTALKPVPSAWIVRRAPGNHGWRGLLAAAGRVYPCALGRCGISVMKREGDGATPAGAMRLLGGWCRRDRLPLLRCLHGLGAIRAGDGWCDDPLHPAYNRPVRLPFRPSHERMMRDDRLYDVCLMLDWNIVLRACFRGSAIFFHMAGPGFPPTAGCVAVEPAAMLRLLDAMRRGAALRVLP